jgi:hypothetical protein
MEHHSSSPRILAAAVSEWLLVLPAAVFLAAAALRLLQPRQYEPARTSWILFEWATTHISHTGAALLFIALPAIAVVAGCAMLLLSWRKNETLRQDMASALTSLRHHLAIGVLGTGTLLAGAILVAVLLHIIAD